MKFFPLLSLFLILLLLISLLSVYWIYGEWMKEKKKIGLEKIIYKEVDSVSIIQKARKGYIQGSESFFREKFGKVWKDTLTFVKDSLVIRDSLQLISYPVEYYESDTTLRFAKELAKDSILAIFSLHQRFYTYPIFCFEDSIKIDSLSVPVFRDTVFVNKISIFQKLKFGLIGVGLIKLIEGIGVIL